jgi:hypothetical protein
MKRILCPPLWVCHQHHQPLTFVDIADVNPRTTFLEYKGIEKEDIAVMELKDIEKQYALVLSVIKLAQKNPQVPRVSGLASARDTVALLAESGLFDSAISLAKLNNYDFRIIFEILTKKCLPG